MTMNCLDTIHRTLSSLDVAQERVQEFFATDEECIAQLVALSEECSPAIESVARSLLGDAQQEGNEYKLQVLIRVMYQRQQPGIISFVSEALLAAQTTDKEAYVSFLLEIDDPLVAGPLLQFAGSVAPPEPSEEPTGEGWALVKALEGLRYYRMKDAIPIALAHLADSSERVRRAAHDLLTELEAKNAAPNLLAQLAREDDEDNAIAMIHTLANWHYQPAQSTFRRLLETDVTTAVRHALKDAIEQFSGPAA
jgi:hypothetical protein